jgi:hypothetical protein
MSVFLAFASRWICFQSIIWVILHILRLFAWGRVRGGVAGVPGEGRKREKEREPERVLSLY